MRWFYNLTISKKLLSGFAMVTVLTAIIGVFGICNLYAIAEEDKQLYEHYTVPISDLLDVMQEYSDIRFDTRQMILENDPAKREKIVQAARGSMQKMKESSQRFENSIVTEEARKLFAVYKNGFTEFEGYVEKLGGFAAANRPELARQLAETDGERLDKVMDDSMNALQELKTKQAKQKAENNQDTAHRIILIMLTIFVLSVGLAAFMGIFIARIISRPVTRLVEVAESLAVGDVNQKVEVTAKDEIGVLMQAFAKMIDSIKEQAAAAEKIAAGDVTVQVKIRSDQDIFMQSFTKMIASVRDQATAAERIAAGDINVEVKVRSENDVLGKNLNKCIANIHRMITDINMLAVAAVEGRLSTRADASQHGGEYREIVQGLNDILDKVTEPIKEASGVLAQMAAGNLQVRVTGDYRGDNAAIKNAMNETLDALNRAFSDIKNVAEQVAAGAQQIAASGEVLSQGSTEQASSLEEVTASMAHVAEQTKQNAVNANQASEFSTSAKEQAITGKTQMQDMVKAMSEINDSSNNVCKIIKVIDEIAFQTNILALNAAVEAARAGQHGKGFAVVAEEVRNLAARSANAAKETTTMIEGSMKKVDNGTKIANETATALNSIVDEVTKAAELVSTIAVASNEQATAISQVNQAIAQVSQVVQTNSATAEESASASEELSSQADILKKNVGMFKLQQVSSRRTEAINQDMMHMIESIVDKKQQGGSAKPERTLASKAKIVLDDTDFGKY